MLKLSLRIKVTIVVLISLCIVTIMLIGLAIVSNHYSEQRYVSAMTSGNALLWEKIIDSQLDFINASTKNLVRDRNLRNAIKNLEWDVIKEEGESNYLFLSTGGIINRLLITDGGGKVLFSKPSVERTDYNTVLLQQAKETDRLTRGITQMSDGHLYAVVVFPLHVRGQRVGFGIFAKDLQAATKEVAATTDAQAAIITNQKSVEYTTESELFSTLKLDIPSQGETGFSVNSANGQIYAVISTPIKDSKNEAVANLVTAKEFTDSYNQQHRIELLGYFFTALVVVLALVGLFFYLRNSLHPLQVVADNLKEVASGDLTLTVSSNSNDEIGLLQQATGDTIANLNKVLKEVDTAVDLLQKSVEEMKYNSNYQNTSVKMQYHEVEHAARSMHEMSATVEDIAKNASHAAESAKEADTQASNGQIVVQQSVQSIEVLSSGIDRASLAVKKLKENSSGIVSILDVIREIADQTNLLALNAAIEAARAGESGRGFAVVADEVRTLANRTQSSTDEIQRVIDQLQSDSDETVTFMDESCRNVEQSVDQIEKVKSTLTSIADAIANISDMNTRIASASEQQSIVAKEVNKNISEISSLAENTMSAANLTNEATDKIQSSSDGLSALLKHFKF